MSLSTPVRAVICTALLAAPLRADVVDGSFEAGNLAAWNPVANVEVRNDQIPSDGAWNVVFYASIGNIRQSFATTVGVKYSLSFDFAIEGDPNQVGSMLVQVYEDVPVGDWPFGVMDFVAQRNSAAGGFSGWRTVSYDFTARSTLATLQFSNDTISGIRVHLDDVSVVAAVPEVSAIFFGGLASTLGAVVCAIRRRDPMTP